MGSGFKSLAAHPPATYALTWANTFIKFAC